MHTSTQQTHLEEKAIPEGTRRIIFCKEANESVEQEWTGKEWLCLHDDKEEKELTVGIGTILVSQWGYSMSLVDFYEVIKETTKTLLAQKIGEKIIEGDGYNGGTVIADKDKKEKEQVRVYKRTDKQGNGFYLLSRKGGFRKNYHVWDGEPVFYCHAD